MWGIGSVLVSICSLFLARFVSTKTKSYLGTHRLLSNVDLAFTYFFFFRYVSTDLSNVYQLQFHSCVSSCLSDCKQWPACERGSLDPNICNPNILWLHQKTFLKNGEMSLKWCKTTFYWVMNHLIYAFMLLLNTKPMDKWDQYVM